MTTKVMAALDWIRKAGAALFGIGSILFFSWIILSINKSNSKAKPDIIYALEGVGFLYTAFAVVIGFLLAVFYLYLFMTYYSRLHPKEIKDRFRSAAICLFGNIPVAYSYFAVFSSINFPGGD